MQRASFALLLLLFLPPALPTPQKPQYNGAPSVVSASAPFYPLDAWAKGIEGVAALDVRVDSSGNATVAAKSCGHPSLCTAAVQNVLTWRFASGNAGRFSVTYTFRLGGTPTAGFMGNPKIVLDLPTSVTITMPREVSAPYE